MKQLVYILVLGILVISCKTQSSIVTSKEEAKSKGIYSYKEDKNAKTGKKSSGKKNSKNSLAYQIIDKAMDYEGVQYRTGGTTKSGMDCSGLVYTTFKSFDIDVPRTSSSLANQGKKISKNSALPGDLIFFKTNKSRQINHVGLITEVNSDEIKFVHSSTSKGVIISSTKEPYYQRSFSQVNRILQ